MSDHTGTVNGKRKLKIGDLILAGVFAVIYLVLMTIAASGLAFIPIVYLICPLIVGILCGPVYLLYLSKVPRTGAILILSILMGLLLSGTAFYVFFFVVGIGILTEILLHKTGYSLKSLAHSFYLFNLTAICPFTVLYLERDRFLASFVPYYGQEYADSFAKLAPVWIPVPQIVLALAGAFLGTMLGKALLRKHFTKAGLV